ncbi:MAG: 1-deoxy-D-xylulose-5-phosphate reductoisomerase, partial [Alphaproteobacteria bacterium]|nr:1-deoxy-D-xylulose-5-phosphate reductoisomerase [Alphaproteobacteria bacterium]
MSVKSVNILGVTGSVGGAAADVILSAPENFDVRVVTAHSNAGKLADLAVKLKAKKAVIADRKNFSELRERLRTTGIEAAAGLEEAQIPADLTIAAIVGMAGLRPVMAAVKNSKCVAIANKEPLVAAGPLIMAEVKKYGTTILPVDSEHNAVFQVFENENRNSIEKIILTASGGPFRTWTAQEMERATPEQALAHPNWSMGPKISIDSATMMNKALEVIEAHYLFGMPPEKIEVLVHPQSVVHSMVEYKDGSILAQMAASDMRTPLAHVLAWPQRMQTPGQRLDLVKLKRLDFDLPDLQRFPLLKMAWRALEAGPSACISLNAANELAVEAFLQGKTGFHGIINLICFTMDKVEDVSLSS